jgi:hypothetical protein
LTGTPVAGLILIYPGIQIKAIKGNTLLSDANFSQIRSHLGVKAVSVHAQIEGRIPETDQSWRDTAGLFHEQVYCIAFNQISDSSHRAVQNHVRKITS